MLASYEINRAQYSDLISFLREFRCDHLQVKLLHFLARHRLTKFSFNTITDALGVAKANLKEELDALIHKGILFQQNNNGLIVYSLVNTFSIQEYFDKLSMLDWSEIVILTRSLRPLSRHSH